MIILNTKNGMFDEKRNAKLLVEEFWRLVAFLREKHPAILEEFRKNERERKSV